MTTPTDLPPRPGRSCPLHYRYGPAVFARPAQAACEVLYVVGGLYGNVPALEHVLALFAQERGDKRLVFNGDFHWFDTDPADFARIQTAVLAHDALRGNVETELAEDPPESDAADDAGCGCAYPDWVGEGVVERSNRILQRLRHTARAVDAAQPGTRHALAALPMWRRIDVGPLRLGVVHGDAESLAGWGFAQEHLRDAAHRRLVHRWFDAAQVDAFACSHTCLPVFHTLRQAGRPGDRRVLNNGATGMPNFSGDAAGLLTRIALTPYDGPARRHGLIHTAGGARVYIDALAVEVDAPRWQRQFLAQWPAGSAAHASYWHRLQAGPRYEPAAALFTTVDPVA